MKKILRKQQLFLLAMGLLGLALIGCSSEDPTGGSSTGGQTAVRVDEQLQEPANEGLSLIFSPEPVEASATGSADPENTQPGVVSADAKEVSNTDGELPTGGAPDVPSAETVEAVGPSVEESGDASTQKSVDMLPQTEDAQFKSLTQLGRGDGNTGIVVTGTGSASSAPDLATLRLGVESIQSTVSEARTAAAEAMTSVITSVREDGVAEDDIQTGYFSIQPRYTGREVTRCIEAEDSTEDSVGDSASGQEGGTVGPGIAQTMKEQCFQEYQSIITGYQVSNSLTVLVRDLDTVDDVIDGSVEAGGDNIRFNGLSFTLEDTSTLMGEARMSAVEDLSAKAAELANLAGVELGELVYLTETGSAPPPVVRAEFALARAASAQADGVGTPISPGEVSVRVSVLGQYLITHPEEG